MDISREPSERDLPLLGERSQVASAPSTPRVALLDNAKGALIYCVVLYHVAVVYTGADRPETPVRYASGFLMVLKPVVMPGFCLISGHLSRASLTPKHVRGLYQALATYALFQLLYFGILATMRCRTGTTASRCRCCLCSSSSRRRRPSPGSSQRSRSRSPPAAQQPLKPAPPQDRRPKE